MAITYPLTPPAALTTALARWTGMSTVAMQKSAFTGQQQVVAHAGSWWEVDLEVPVRKRADADAVEAFLLALNGIQGTFRYGDRTRTTGRGTLSGSPKVALFGGFAANTSTLTVQFAVGTPAVGDWLQIGNQLFRVTQVNSATEWEVFPKSRGIAGGADIIYTSPTGLFRLKSPVPFEVRNDRLYGSYRLPLIEVVT